MRETLAGFGFHVGINDGQKGVELVRAYSDPAQERHSLQIEINRALYMNELSLERAAGFDTLQTNLTRFATVVCDYARSKTA